VVYLELVKILSVGISCSRIKGISVPGEAMIASRWGKPSRVVGSLQLELSRFVLSADFNIHGRGYIISQRFVEWTRVAQNYIFSLLIISIVQNEVPGYVAKRDTLSLSLCPDLNHSIFNSANCTPESRQCDSSVVVAKK